MSFVFASSHLPAAAPPALQAAEEENAHTHAHSSSSGVRAFSHLPAAPHRPPAPARQAPGSAQDPEAWERIHIEDHSPRFAQQVRAALKDEVAESPIAAALMAHVGRLPNPITVKQRERGMSQTVTDEHGHITIHLNPSAMTGATLSHELAHVIQQAHTHRALRHFQHQGRQPAGAEVEAAIMAGRDALHRIAPVKDERDPGPEHKENEAMRISNIVNAERTAAQMQHLPAGQRTPAEYRRRQTRCESAPRHQNNHHPLPPGSLYGAYDFQHVKQLLGF